LPDAVEPAEDLREAAAADFFFVDLDLDAGALSPPSLATDFVPAFFDADVAGFFLVAVELLAGTLFFFGAVSES